MDGDITPGEIEAVTVAEIVDDTLMPIGKVQFSVGRRFREVLEAIRLEPRPGSRRVPVRAGAGNRDRVLRTASQRHDPRRASCGR
jgi:hypothetical protein